MIGLVVLGLIIFGPKRLPEMGSSLGRTIREFQKSIHEVTNPEPPSSVPPSAVQTAQPVAPAPESAPVIASAPSAPQAPVVEEGAAHLVEEDAVR
jgi:sec-independent protein translocase protein TatA